MINVVVDGILHPQPPRLSNRAMHLRDGHITTRNVISFGRNVSNMTVFFVSLGAKGISAERVSVTVCVLSSCTVVANES